MLVRKLLDQFLVLFFPQLGVDVMIQALALLSRDFSLRLLCAQLFLQFAPTLFSFGGAGGQHNVGIGVGGRCGIRCGLQLFETLMLALSRHKFGRHVGEVVVFEYYKTMLEWQTDENVKLSDFPTSFHMQKWVRGPNLNHRAGSGYLVQLRLPTFT
jgi:hypothetical protein